MGVIGLSENQFLPERMFRIFDANEARTKTISRPTLPLQYLHQICSQLPSLALVQPGPYTGFYQTISRPT